MNSTRRIALGIGTAVTTFLLAAVVVIESLGAGEAPGIGILGVFGGLVAGLLAGALVVAYAGRLSGATTAALAAYATLGPAFVAIAGLSYVNVPGADAVFSFPVHVGTSVVLAVVAGVLAVYLRRRERPVAA
jgi:hypothetical protein